MLHADLTLLLHTHQDADGACFLVYRLHALHEGTAQLLRTCVASGTAYPYGARDCLCYCRPVLQPNCLPTLAFHVNVYALITPPPWSFLSLFQRPLQRSPSVVTVVTLASTYCSFPVCGDRQEFRESPFVRPERASLSFAFLLYLPPLWRAASERELRWRPSDHLPFVSFAHLYGQLIIAFLRSLAPLWRAARPPSERSVGGPVIFAFCFICPPSWHGPSGPAFHCLLPNYGARPERVS